MYIHSHLEVALSTAANGHQLVRKNTNSQRKHRCAVEDGPAQVQRSAYDQPQGRGEIFEQLHPHKTDQSRLLAQHPGRRIHQMIVHYFTDLYGTISH